CAGRGADGGWVRPVAAASRTGDRANVLQTRPAPHRLYFSVRTNTGGAGRSSPACRTSRTYLWHLTQVSVSSTYVRAAPSRFLSLVFLTTSSAMRRKFLLQGCYGGVLLPRHSATLLMSINSSACLPIILKSLTATPSSTFWEFSSLRFIRAVSLGS